MGKPRFITINPKIWLHCVHLDFVNRHRVLVSSQETKNQEVTCAIKRIGFYRVESLFAVNRINFRVKNITNKKRLA